MTSIICFFLFSATSGFAEAYFWASHPKVNQSWSHITLTILRLFVLIPVFIHDGFWATGSCVLMFPFLHDGMYYVTRNRIDPTKYPDGWLSESTTTGAYVSFNAIERVMFAVVSVLTIITFIL